MSLILPVSILKGPPPRSYPINKVCVFYVFVQSYDFCASIRDYYGSKPNFKLKQIPYKQNISKYDLNEKKDQVLAWSFFKQ